MPAKKKESVEEATKPARKPATRKKAPAKKQAEPEASAAALTPDLVMQMMAQMQEMSQELGKLREEVANVKTSPAAAEIDEYLPDAVLEDPFTPDQLAEMEAQLDNFMETGSIPDSDSTEVTAEETAALLAGLEEANQEIEQAEAEEELAEEIAEVEQEVTLELVEAQADEEHEVAELEADIAAEAEAVLLEETLEVQATADEESGPAVAEVEELPDGLSEEELAAAIRGQIESQDAPVLNAETGEAPQEDDGGMMSPDDIAAMLAASNSEAPAEPEASSEDEGGMMSPDDIAAMLAASNSDAPAEPATASEDDGGMMSPDDIAAMLAASNSEAPAEPATASEDDGGMMSPDDIAAMLAASNSEAPAEETVLSDAEIAAMVEANAPQGTALDDADDNLSEEELAALIRGEIDKQDAPNQAAEASSDDGDGGGNMSDDDIAAMLANASEDKLAEAAPAASAPGVLSAAELSALLNDGTPDAEFVPQASTAMSDDELQKLMDEAEAGQGQSSAPVEASDVPEVDIPAAAAPAQTASPKAAPAAKVSTSTEESDLGALRVVPAPMAVRALALPLGFQDGKLKLMAAEPVDEEAIDRISKVTGFGVVVVKAPMEQVVPALREAYIEIHDDQARKAILETSHTKVWLVSQLVSKFKKSA